VEQAEMYDSRAFVERVIFSLESPIPVTWIVGSALTYDSATNKGVPGVNGVVELIRQEFVSNPDTSRLLEAALLDGSDNAYQAAFRFLTGYKGQKQANEIVRKAVLRAYQLQLAGGLSDDGLRAAERDIQNWLLPSGVRALGQIVHSSGTGRANVLTTNFDPLVEIAIRQAGGNPVTTFFHRDGSPQTVHTQESHVTHLHGYWIGSDTLHTPHQLRQERPQLSAALAGVLRSSVVIVLGYGGWDDVITQAIADVVAEDGSFPEVIWAFYEQKTEEIERQYGHILSSLAGGFARNRVSAYAGVDCHSVLAEVAARMRPEAEPLIAQSAPGGFAPQIWKDVVAAPVQIRTSDAIPVVDKFVGRRHELGALHQTSANIISISGLGGQGKSILAAQFIDEIRHATEHAVVDWRDCKEEGNTANLSLCLFLELVTKGEISARAIATATAQELASIVCDRIRDLHGVLVFDNIDTYVDVENCEPIGVIKAVVDKHMGSNSQFRIVLTSRPQIKLPHAKFFPLHIGGLAREATQQLFEKASATNLAETDLDRLYALTEGHPLGVMLLAAQKLSTQKSLNAILDELATSESPIGRQILRTTYRLLKAEDQEVLRTLAELERPESELDLDDITGLRFNRLRKAVRRLRDMNLIMDRLDNSGHLLVDLHPLVRQFIRHEYPGKDRESFIGRVLTFFDTRLLPLRKQIEMVGVPASALHLWVHKVEVLINKGSWVEAAEELSLISDQLEKQGLNEDEIRVGEKVLSGAEWRVLLEESKRFRKFLGGVLATMTYFGKHDRVDHWLNHYASQVTRGGADSVVIASSRAFDAWFRKDYDQSLSFAQEAKERHATVDVDLDTTPETIYALALRDSGKLELALPELLEGLSLSDALAGTGTKSGQYYGNLGRCLHMGGNIDDALRAYKACYKQFGDLDATGVNAGWLRQWVGEALQVKGQLPEAFACYLAAKSLWKMTSPVLLRGAENCIQNLMEHERGLREEDLPDWKAERVFRQWART
jgi:tetratricopeptide (TPR) repeat protein